jgi:hypothetical protein
MAVLPLDAKRRMLGPAEHLENLARASRIRDPVTDDAHDVSGTRVFD